MFSTLIIEARTTSRLFFSKHCSAYIHRDSTVTLKQIIKNVCYDIHQNMCRIKPYLKRTFYGIFKYFPQRVQDFAAAKAEKQYKNQVYCQDPMKKRFTQYFIYMPEVKALKKKVLDAVKILDNSCWLHM